MKTRNLLRLPVWHELLYAGKSLMLTNDISLWKIWLSWDDIPNFLDVAVSFLMPFAKMVIQRYILRHFKILFNDSYRNFSHSKKSWRTLDRVCVRLHGSKACTLNQQLTVKVKGSAEMKSLLLHYRFYYFLQSRLTAVFGYHFVFEKTGLGIFWWQFFLN